MESETTPNPTNDELTQQINDLKNAEQAKAQQLKMQSEQLQQRLQQTIAAKVSTLGQITELEHSAKENERNQHRLEGALDILQALTG